MFVLPSRFPSHHVIDKEVEKKRTHKAGAACRYKEMLPPSGEVQLLQLLS